MKKILIVASFDFSLINFRGDLINSWLKKGLLVVAAAPGLKYEEHFKKMGIKYHKIPLGRTALKPLQDILLALRLISLLIVETPNILFLYTVKPVIYGSVAALFFRKLRVFSMITGLGYIYANASKKKSILTVFVTTLYRIALSRNEKVFFQNPDDKKFFISEKMVNPKIAVTINGSGVNLDYYSFEPPAFGPPVFLMIARLLKEKGISEYVEAAGIVRRRYPAARFQLIVWDLGDRHSVFTEEEINKWKADGHVEIMGHKEDVKPYLKKSAVYVLPSYREGTPRTVLEAMAMGRAIITTNVPGCRETVVEGVNGYLVPAKDIETLADVMARFIEEPELIVAMGRESRRIAEDKYDVHQVNRVINREMGIE